MNKGIIYVMSTVVPGLLKIGQTQTDQYETRMRTLESNGYANITGLKRRFAIEVDDYQDKEKLIHTIFNKSQVDSTELFALNIDIVIQLLSSFEGTQIYPKSCKKSEVFNEATKELENKRLESSIPDGLYFLERNVKGFGKVKGKMQVKNGKLTVLKGSICAPIGTKDVPPIRETANIKDNVLQDDITCNSLSAAGTIILANSNNGWKEWKDKNNKTLKSLRETFAK